MQFLAVIFLCVLSSLPIVAQTSKPQLDTLEHFSRTAATTPRVIERRIIDTTQSATLNQHPSLSISPLTVSGYKTLSITNGSGSTLLFEQEMDLLIHGELSPGVYLESKLHDRNMPMVAQGNTQSLNDIDKLYLKLTGAHFSATLGDIQINHTTQEFTALSQLSRGANIQFHSSHFNSHMSYGSKSTAHHTTLFYGSNDLQTRFQLYSKEGSFVSIVPGSESVWVNGHLMSPQEDYSLEYGTGVIYFSSKHLISSKDFITISYEYILSDLQSQTFALSNSITHSILSLTAGIIYSGTDKDQPNGTPLTPSEKYLLSTDSFSDTITAPQSHLLTGVTADATIHNRWYFHNEVSFSEQDSNSITPHSQKRGWLYSLLYTSDSSRHKPKLPVRATYKGFYKDHSYQTFIEFFEEQQFKNMWGFSIPRGSFKSDNISLEWYPSAHTSISTGWAYANASSPLQNITNNSNSERYSSSLKHQSRSASLMSEVTHTMIYGTAITPEYSLFRNTPHLTRTGHTLSAKLLTWSLVPFVDSRMAYYTAPTSTRLFTSTISTGAHYTKPSIEFISTATHHQIRTTLPTTKRLTDSTQALEFSQSIVLNPTPWWNSSGTLNMRKHSTRTIGSGLFWSTSSEHSLSTPNNLVTSQFSYSLENGTDQSWIPYYEKVPEGTGTIRYDSTSKEFVEGVDDGDYIYRGDIRDTLTSGSTRYSLSTSLSIALNPGALISQGILHDIFLSGLYRWSQQDSTTQNFYPLFDPQPLIQSGLDGEQFFESTVQWTHPKHTSHWAYTYTNHHRTETNTLTPMTSSLPNSLSATLSSHTLKGWGKLFTKLWLYPFIQFSNRSRLDHSTLSPTTLYSFAREDYKGELQYRFSPAITPLVGFHFAQTTGTYQSVETITDMYTLIYTLTIQPKKEITIEAGGSSVNTVSTTQTKYIAHWSDNFSPGWTHRLTAQASVNLEEFLTLSCNYLYRIEPGKDFQSLHAQARAYF
ncbi:MAG: hypothetical protein OCC49_11960 [Fibrobacterales bacterium]